MMSFCFSRRRSVFHDVVLFFTMSFCFSGRHPIFHDVVLFFTTSYYLSRRPPILRMSYFQDDVLLSNVAMHDDGLYGSS